LALGDRDRSDIAQPLEDRYLFLRKDAQRLVQLAAPRYSVFILGGTTTIA
jgi:hypothetical protein